MLDFVGLFGFGTTLVDQLGTETVVWDVVVESGCGLVRVGVLSLDAFSSGRTVLKSATVDILTFVKLSGRLVTVDAWLITVRPLVVSVARGVWEIASLAGTREERGETVDFALESGLDLACRPDLTKGWPRVELARW